MDILLRYSASLTTDDVRTNILLPFEVPQDYDRLAVLIHYGPKEVYEPAIIQPQIADCVRKYFPAGTELTARDMEKYPCLLNFVTLSLDCGDTHLGCAHRHPPVQTLEISAESASPGFAPHAVTAGMWRAVLHVHAVVAGIVDYQLAVCGMERGESNVLLPTI